MLDIRKCRKLIGIMLALILLSFFDVERQDVSAQTLPEASYIEHSEKEVMLTCAKQLPSGVDKFVPVENKTDKLITREEKPSHAPLVRFIAVVTVLFFAIQVVYHATIHRYGCHMIDVWENIIYIHQMDGKKKEGLLCN